MKKLPLLLWGFLLSVGIVACSDDVAPIEKPSTENLGKMMPKQQAKEHFARILSKAVYEQQGLRALLKEEALQQFDENYDVLYHLVKDKRVGQHTFRELLVRYSSEAEMASIEKSVPLLNILLPEIAPFDVKPENLNVQNAEVPVAVANDSSSVLYLNGAKEGDIPLNEMPAFHLFVVNENTRVELASQTTRGASNGIIFKSPNYDRSRRKDARTTMAYLDLDLKLKLAFHYFYKDDGSVNQKGFQRDYIYYGITPHNRPGSLNRSVREYLSTLKIHPSLFNIISDDVIENNIDGGDPRIKQDHVGKRGGPGHSDEKLIQIMWTRGSFNFKFEVVRGNDSKPYVLYIPLKPHEIWDFNLIRYRKHGTLFRKEHNTYTIKPSLFTSKVINLGEFSGMMPKWDIENEGIVRHINIYEEDGVEEREYTEEYEKETLNKAMFQGDLKLNLGAKAKESELGISGSLATESKERSKVTLRIIRKTGSDHLGSIPVYFYDPIVVEQVGDSCRLFTYSTGAINFTIISK